MRRSRPLRVVLDTNVLVAALRSPSGASSRLMTAALEGRFTLLVSTALGLEYEAVLTRPAHLEAAGIDRAIALDLLQRLAAIAEAVDIRYRWRPRLLDPGDELVLEAAINGRADVLVTFNRCGDEIPQDLLRPGRRPTSAQARSARRRR